MEGGISTESAPKMDDRMKQMFQEKLQQVSNISEANKRILNEISRNFATKAPGYLTKSLSLIEELSNNNQTINEIFNELSGTLDKSNEAQAEGQPFKTELTEETEISEEDSTRPV